ncbi:MAG: amidohydrolase family protein [Acidobacteria bacterium]|nr:amidohydrolase family protein [Acidobacteriota bacterium]
MVGVAMATIRSPQGRKAAEGMHIEAGHKNSFLYQWMEPAYFEEVIEHLVRRNVFMNPTLHFEWKALTEHAREHELEDSRLLSNPNLQYMPMDERLVTLGQYHWADKRSAEEKKQFLNGYRKVQDFLRRFVKAGGKIYSGTDSAAATTPGLSLHHEMELLVDAGLSPTEAILTSTRWGAEIIGLDKKLGTVEVNKLADLVILRGNPLEDIRRTREIEQVVRDGEIVDLSYHSDYRFPFRRPGPQSKHLYNPIPVLLDINPPVGAQGTEVKLRVSGRGFVPNSVVLFDEVPVGTVWVSPTELSAVLTPSHTSRAGTFLMRVETPKPGGGVSAPIEFIVTFP